MEACVILESLVFITDILIPELYNLLYYTLCEFIWYCIPEMAAILKNGGHFAQIAWLTLYNKKLSYKITLFILVTGENKVGKTSFIITN